MTLQQSDGYITRSPLIIESAFLREYRRQAEELCSFTQGAALSIPQNMALDALIDENFEDSDIEVFNSNIKEIENRVKRTTLRKFLDSTYTHDYIVSGNGTLFKPESIGGKNAMGSFVMYLLDTRKQVKKLMKQALSANDIDKADMYDLQQKVFKVLTNAFYGALGQGSFIFHDINTAPACTQTGFNLISNLIICFEQFFADNWRFTEYGDVFEYLAYVSKKPKVFDCFVDDMETYTPERVMERLRKNYKEGWKEDLELEETILDRIKMMADEDPESMFRLYYSNNFFEFIRLPAIKEIISQCLQFTIMSGNPEDPREDAANEALSAFNEAMFDFVVADIIFEEQMKFVEEREKESVLLTDTDSTFVYFGIFLEYLEEELNYDTEVFENFVTASSVFFYVLSHLAHMLLMKWADRLNIEEDKKKHISLKNEYIYGRIMLTDNKKSYAGLIISREAIIVPESKRFDIKGLSIKKTSVNKISRDYFQSVLENDILARKIIEMPHIIGKFVEYEQMIKKSIEEGKIEFGIPKKFSGINAYDYPYRMEVVRGSVVWNHFFPTDPVQLMDLPKTFPMFGETIDEFDLVVARNEDEFSPEDRKLVDELRSYVFEQNKELKEKGFTRLCIPSTQKSIPTFFIPFIDKEALINKNMSNGLILLKSLGIHCIEARSTNKMSNMIRF